MHPLIQLYIAVAIAKTILALATVPTMMIVNTRMSWRYGRLEGTEVIPFYYVVTAFFGWPWLLYEERLSFFRIITLRECMKAYRALFRKHGGV